MSNIFFKIYNIIKTYRLIAWPLILAFIVGIAILAQHIRFEEDITQLIPNNEKSEVTQRVLNTVSFADKIVVNIETKGEANADSLVNYAQDFVNRIEKELSTYVKDVQGQIDDEKVIDIYDFVYDNLPLFLTDEDYKIIEQKIQTDSIQKAINYSYKAILSPAGVITKRFIVKDPLQLTSLGLQKLAQLQLGDEFELHNGFLITKDHKNVILFLTTAQATNETDKNTYFVEQLEKIKKELNTKYKESVSASIFGSTLYAVANAKQIKTDIQTTVTIAMSILLIILVVFYKKITVPILIFIPTILGALVAIASLYIIKQKISSISLGIGSVLLGVTLDYSLHILTHFKKNNNVKELYRDVALPILMSSLTTATAFLCLIFVKSEALKDLGIFAAISVVTASVFALIIIPQAYRFKTKEANSTTVIDTIAGINYDKNKPLIIGVIGLFIIGLFLFKKVGFNSDLNTMNYQPKSLVEAEQKLDRITNNSAKTIYMVSYGETLDEALGYTNELHQELQVHKEKGNIINYSSLGGVVFSKEKQLERIAKWNSFWNEERKNDVITQLIAKGSEIGFKPKTFSAFYTTLTTAKKTIDFDDYGDLETLHLNEYLTIEDDFVTVMSAVKVNHDQATQITTDLDTNKNRIVIDRKKLNETFLGNLKNDFDTLIGYSMIAVLLILLLLYRNLVLTIITALPIAITWIITLGMMKMLAIDFNIFNIIISTFIFGLGVDYSIFITNGLIKEYTYGKKELTTYKTSIILSVITTILGVGVLIFAKHPALKSISIVSLIGIFAAVLVVYTIQPILFRVCITNRSKKGLSPLKLRQTIHSLFSFNFFIDGSFLVSTISALIIPWIPIEKKKKMGVFHMLVSKLMKAVLYTNPFVSKKIENTIGETFDKQCIIIANHASFLDILTIGMLHPKLIFLVKDAVYNSKIYGKAVRLAGFYPVSSGIDKGVTHLKEKVEQGYSLIAFPEGTRTETAKMARFHKGSFFLAEELGLDIVPVLIHGNSNVSPKGDFIIENGKIHVKILPRIAAGDTTYGEGYAKRTKQISKYFKKAYQDLQNELEHVTYYQTTLLNNYKYKTCYSAVKKQILNQKHINYKIASFVDTEDKVLYYGNDHGQQLIHLSLYKPYAKMYGYIREKERLNVAQHCFSTIRNKITYIENTAIETIKFNVLLLDLAEDDTTLDLESLLSLEVDRIIIKTNGKNISKPNGFELHYNEDQIVVLNRI
ncbi:MMPL family transporter [Aquimarina rhabdastrellae]